MKTLTAPPLRLFAAACIATTVACGSSSAPAPVPTVTTTQPTLASVAVTGTAPIVPNSSQFTATALMTDSSSSNVSPSSFWSSSNIAVATVSNTGVVTAQSQGDAVITAVYQNITGRLSISIPKPNPFTISGVVTDSLGGGNLPNVNVAVTDSALIPQITSTNSTGAYSVSNVLAGPVSVVAGAGGYINNSQQLTLSANRTVNIVLQRATLP